MKIFFTLFVAFAALYLVVPDSMKEQAKSFLPVMDVNAASQRLITQINDNVDQQILQAVQQQENKHQQRFKQLESKISELTLLVETQQLTMSQPQVTKAIQDKFNDATTNQGVIIARPAIQKNNGIVKVNALAPEVKIKTDEQQLVIQTQANLQGIVERMNNASLKSLTY